MELASFIPELIQIGLTEDQALVYATMLQIGVLPASKIAIKSGLSRPLTYKLLDELIGLKLVLKRDEVGMVARFSAEHPLKLRELIDQKREQVTKNATTLEGVMSTLISTYTTLSGKPGVRILAGISGIQELYDDILNENKDIFLIRSPKDVSHPELGSIVENQIDARVKLGIHTQTITPLTNETHEELTTWDSVHLVSRRLTLLEKLNIPAQIIIYGNKVAITAYEGELMTTIIDNQAICASFRILFAFMWQTLETEDAEIRSELERKAFIQPHLLT